jgi:hypothetical protein
MGFGVITETFGSESASAHATLHAKKALMFDTWSLSGVWCFS